MSIHLKNLQELATEFYKVKSGLFAIIMNLLFKKTKICELSSGINVANRHMHTSRFGADSMTNLGSRIWKLIPDKIKNGSTLPVFTSRVKIWNIGYCPFGICRRFVKDLGFFEVESTQ